jgi:hypothetical protein
VIKALFPVFSLSSINLPLFRKTKENMEFVIPLCFVLSFLWPLIFAFDFVDDCNHHGGPIFAEKNGSARIGCKTDKYFGYCTLTRINPHFTCQIEINRSYRPKKVDCLNDARIKFTGNTANKYCEFLIEDLQQDGKNLYI